MLLDWRWWWGHFSTYIFWFLILSLQYQAYYSFATPKLSTFYWKRKRKFNRLPDEQILQSCLFSGDTLPLPLLFKDATRGRLHRRAASRPCLLLLAHGTPYAEAVQRNLSESFNLLRCIWCLGPHQMRKGPGNVATPGGGEERVVAIDIGICSHRQGWDVGFGTGVVPRRRRAASGALRQRRWRLGWAVAPGVGSGLGQSSGRRGGRRWSSCWCWAEGGGHCL
jgi:hypothetical protein